jgi:hypothetical protein
MVINGDFNHGTLRHGGTLWDFPIDRQMGPKDVTNGTWLAASH